MTMFYTGVGSRETPTVIIDQMKEIARHLNRLGWVLRSGGADGADTAFEEAAASAQIFLPWPGFNGRTSKLNRPSMDAYIMASKVHPAWATLKHGAKALHARNCHQVLGLDLRTPSSMLICWTPDGCVNRETRTRLTGGTATAIVVASENGVPVFNLQSGESFELALNHAAALLDRL